MIFVSEPAKKDYVEIFTEACNRSHKATAGNLYDTMIKYTKFQKIASDFYAYYHFKLNSELNLEDFLSFRHKYKEKNHRGLKNFANHRRNGMIFGNPDLVLKNFSIVSKHYEKIDKKLLVEIFKRFDTNNDGFVDLRELKIGLQEVLTYESIEELFEHFDEDKDNYLNIGEFLSLFGPVNLSLSFKIKLGAQC